MAHVRELTFTKGHGTSNDFILLDDTEGLLDLSVADVIFLCDRRRGIGADGVLRVVRTRNLPEYVGVADEAEFFMDYRNADGSLAEMCGNGARVFVRFLDAVGLLTEPTATIATRGGLRPVILNRDLTVTIDMGIATQPASVEPVTVLIDDHVWPAAGVLIPNPHAVVFVENFDDIGSLDIAPRTTPESTFPDGVNVEFVIDVGLGHLAFRVFERGVGQTQSCGTGACAVAWASRRRPGFDAPAFTDGNSSEAGTSTRVDVLGGTLYVTERADGHLLLTGPADLVARGKVLLPG